MNYALDALWWQLKTPIIRDLASLLTAPPLWESGHELPVNILLGNQGFRFLLQLDEQSPSITISNNQRLGHYAESLLLYWFQHAPHSQLIAHELKISDNQQTLGSLDFLVKLSGSLYHIELCCKYYGATFGKPENMVGLNPQDSLLHKQRKLQQQLSLSQHPITQQYFKSLSLNPQAIESVSIIRGNAFTRSGRLPDHVYHPQAWTGILIEEATTWQQLATPNTYLYPIPKQQYLSPARVKVQQTINFAMVHHAPAGLFAIMQQRHDGYYHEIQRIMYRPSTP